MANNFINGGMESGAQQFCLKWNSFGSNLATSFSNLFKSETLADVTLFCDGVSFRAHKLILAACSKHLADLFETAPLHQNLLVILDGTSAVNMAALLEFMYKGEVHVSQDSLSSFLKAAECLQVKGLSIEHEKLVRSQSMDPSGNGEMESPTSRSSNGSNKPLKVEADMPPQSPSSYSPAMSPYLQHHHYRQPYDRRPLRSPTLQERASVLRDGSKSGRPPSPGPMSLAYRPSSSSSCSLPPSQQPEADAALPERFENDPQATALICPPSEANSADHCHRDPGCPEDLRMKLDPTPIQEEPLSSTGNSNSIVPMNTAIANGASLGMYDAADTNMNKDRDLIPTTLWNSVTSKLSKTGAITTPDGKKLKCPFCERLYGYETNLRAHIRQRHQGIRVPCPFCSRTFTRNNTVRRHIAREHKTELSLKAFQQQVHNP
ncbi:PREDICTED: protein bric-a-brac 1 isoform X2 [Nicrophorus vespilloides]|uniref:Protein bric-a-brac 1 isoform X2 n=1 Tax=Nicrophorus vespilloides TaxID=110193 RepID=A0ABM1M9T5_NICVS|nr:PREDICTED: protein bric-a-brac 1 isoform X2 [Nicrophorus vespilloides]